MIKLYRGRTSIFICFYIISILISSKNIYSQDDGFNILVLNSYHQGHFWESNILDGLETLIEKSEEQEINLKVEYLDFRNKNDMQYINSLKKMLESKYPKGSIDAVYTVDDESYVAFKDEILNENSSFYKVPLVFSGVDNKLDGTLEEKKYMSGIYHGDDSLDLFNLMKRLNPDVDTINLIIEKSLYCDSVKTEIDNLVNGYLKNYIDIRYIRSDYIEDIEKQLKNSEDKANTVNIIAGEFQNKISGKYVHPNEVINSIKEYSDDPIYSNDQTYINAGILGGHIDIGQEHAKIIFDMLLKIKSGVNIELIENDVEPRASAYVDFNSVYEYDINPLAIDEDIKVINKKNHQMLIPIWMRWSIFVIIILVITSILVLVPYIAKCRKNKKIQEEEIKREIERSNLKSDFIINLSHELRTPINLILSTSKVLKFNVSDKIVKDNDDIFNKLDSISRNSYRLLKISNNIIDITKAESGMLKLKLENCNIVDVVEDIFTLSVEVAKRKNIDMVFDTDKEEIIIAIDKFQMQRSILNLLSNAIKFTDEYGLINLGISITEKYVVIEVRDNGVGISKENINDIFHRFYQVDSLLTRKCEGSGIGLCVVKDIIEIHGGKISVESEIDKGSSFKVYIPIKIVDECSENYNSKILDINSIVDLEMSDI